MLSFVASWDYLVGEKKNHSVTLVAKHCSPPSVRSKADHHPTLNPIPCQLALVSFDLGKYHRSVGYQNIIFKQRF